MRPVFLTSFLISIVPLFALAIEPIDVQLQNSQGDYYQSLLSFERLVKRKITSDARIAAGRSAWALSLPDRAKELLEEGLRDPNLPQIERARALLTIGIIEYQEGNFQAAALRAEKSSKAFETPGPGRAKALMLWGDSLLRLNSSAPAVEKLQEALEQSSLEDEGEIRFLLGESLLRLERFDEARDNFQSVPVGHERTPIAIRRLAEIALQNKDPKKVDFWLTKGRAEHPEAFLDSWVDYAMGKAALESKENEKARTILEQALARYAPSDFWITLLSAETEVMLRKGEV